MDTKIDFKDPAYYENRELSWIKFDQRVLSEARDCLLYTSPSPRD